MSDVSRLPTVVCAALGMFLSGPLLAQDEQISQLASRDNTLYESETGASSNGAGDVLFSGVIANGGLRRMVFAFDDLSSLPAGTQVSEVQVLVNVNKTIAGPSDFFLHRLTADWGEGDSLVNGNAGVGTAAANDDATWLHRFFPDTLWDSPGGDFVAQPSASVELGGNGDYLIESTPELVADVQFWLHNPDQNFGWILLGDETDAPPTAKRFSSREGSNGPMIMVTYQVVALDVALLTGLWFDPLFNGEGYVVFVTEAGLLIHYFGFDGQGERLWLISEVFDQTFALGDTLSLNMVVADEGSFDAPPDPGSFVVYGSLEATFTACGEGRFVLDGRDGEKTSDVVKLASLSGADC